MVNPALYHLDTAQGIREITIEPIYEEIGGGDILLTGRYILSENNTSLGEVRYAGDDYGWEWDVNKDFEYRYISAIIRFIQDYNEPELLAYMD